MKLKKVIGLFFLTAVVMSSCDDNEMLPGGGSADPYQLEIIVTDASIEGAPPAVGATVEMYSTLAGYINEVGAVQTKTTDAQGKVVFSRAELVDAGVKYFNISLGTKRNWAYTSASKALTLTSGTTQLNTSVANVLPQFIALAGSRFLLTGYSGYGGTFPDVAECRLDDEFVFLKTGRVIAYDAGAACAPHFKGYTVAGLDWSAWTLNAAGTTINIRDLDPDYNSAAGVNAGLTISGDGETVTINFGGGYVATLTKVNE